MSNQLRKSSTPQTTEDKLEQLNKQYDDVQLDNQNVEEKRKAIHTYESSSILYSISFQNCPECRLGTLNNSSKNSIEILEIVNNELTRLRN